MLNTDQGSQFILGGLHSRTAHGRHSGLNRRARTMAGQRVHRLWVHEDEAPLWRAGQAGEAVDMIDNAAALPTSPQPHKKQTE
jgi:hypothetical protein